MKNKMYAAVLIVVMSMLFSSCATLGVVALLVGASFLESTGSSDNYSPPSRNYTSSASSSNVSPPPAKNVVAANKSPARSYSRCPLDNYRISSNYGERISPISGQRHHHNGLDMATSYGSAVYAYKSGTVQTVKIDDYVFGNYVVLSHDGGITSMYAHLSQINVNKGQVVQSGNMIGRVGDSGLTTGAHLHFEVRQNGNAINPLGLF